MRPPGCRLGQAEFERREDSPLVDEPFLQSLTMELQVPMNELGDRRR